MFRIRRISRAVSREDKLALASVLEIYQRAFAYYPEYAAKIARFLEFSGTNNFDLVLMVATGNKERVLGFALCFYFPRLKYAYLDYIASDPERSRRGIGAALYEYLREWLSRAGCRGLFMDVPPDEPALLKDPSLLAVNRRRLAFYEGLGAFPIVGTSYESTAHKVNLGYFTFLVHDPMKAETPVKARALKSLITRVLGIKGGMDDSDRHLGEILSSIRDGRFQLRPPRYQKKNVLSSPGDYDRLDFVTTGDVQRIHHLKEKGYVERPARVRHILKGLEGFELKRHPIRHFSQKHITEVHSPALVRFLENSSKKLARGQLLYPVVFPLRRPAFIPRDWDSQAGWYCIDTFTPITSNVYEVARNAADAALTGAEVVLKGSRRCYVLCRPPGHHAEIQVFGGFCYLNNAALAANYLSKHGKVAFIDIDYHHGNGSQEIFYRRSDVFFLSIHGHPRVAYPHFSGYADEKGEGDGLQFNRNFPLFPGADDERYLSTLKTALNLLRAYRPEYVVVSLGFDTMVKDPTGTFNVSPGGMERIGALISRMEKPVLVVQEGGYSLSNLRTGATAFFKGLLRKG